MSGMKPGPKPRPLGQRVTQYVMVRLTDAQHAALFKHADRVGVQASVIVRNWIREKLGL